MGYYQVLLVDDEEEIRHGIRNRVDWEALGFQLAGDAENGQEALEMAESLRPDVVMTDIKMPFMNGLELCRRLSVKLPSAKLVVFSGFDDFDYAQQAIKAGVSEYILKPINAQEFADVLTRLKGQIDTEISEQRNMETLRQRYQESLPLLCERFFDRLTGGHILPTQLREQAQKLEISFDAPYYGVVVFYPDLQHGHGEALSGAQELIPVSVRRMVEEQLAPAFHLYSFISDTSTVAVVWMERREDVLLLMEQSNQVCKQAHRFLEVTVSAGVGVVCTSPIQIGRSFAGARDALDYRVLMGSGRAIYIEDVEPDQTAQVELTEQDERDLYHVVKLGTPEAIHATVHSILSRLYDARLPMQQYQIFLLELQAALIKLVRSYQLELDEILGTELGRLQELGSVQELENWLAACCVKVSSQISRRRTDSTKQMAERAKSFVADHYQDCDLAVETLCEYLHVSPAYFSSVFKKEVGTSFINYLTGVRMEQAAQLLCGTDEKTYIISGEIGYSDPNYFSYVFKRYFGVSPTKYRTDHAAAAQ